MNDTTELDSCEAFVRYFSKYEGNVRAFVASLLHDWYGVDEVVQATSIVMWRKFDQFNCEGRETDFLNWAFMIARFEVSKYRSKVARDRLVFSDDVQALLDAEAESVAAKQSERERALQDCLKKLAPAQRELNVTTYGSGVSIKDASATLGRSPTALYKAIARIRDSLHVCIERSLAKALDTVYFGFETRHPGGGFTGKYGVSVTVTPERDGGNGFKIELPIERFQRSEEQFPPSPLGLELVDFWTLTAIRNVGLEIISVELLK